MPHIRRTADIIVPPPVHFVSLRCRRGALNSANTCKFSGQKGSSRAAPHGTLPAGRTGVMTGNRNRRRRSHRSGRRQHRRQTQADAPAAEPDESLRDSLVRHFERSTISREVLSAPMSQPEDTNEGDLLVAMGILKPRRHAATRPACSPRQVPLLRRPEIGPC